MSTNTAPAGWHPDPSNPSGALRWWDGAAWTAHTQQAAANVPYQQAPLSFAKRNQLSLTAIGVVAAYIALALTTRVVLLGILPVLMSVRAVKRREALAPFAVVAAVVAVGVAFLALR